MGQAGKIRDGSILADVERLTGDIGAPVGPDGSFNIDILGGNNITTTGTPASNEIAIALTGTTDHAPQIGNATGSLTSIGPLTNGQIIIGSTGADPVAASLVSGDASVTITPGAGTIDLSAGGGGGFEPITRYTVDGGGTGEYATIQTAINAAVAAGEASFLIYLKPGTYTEDLTLPDKNIEFRAANDYGGRYTYITGNHTAAEYGRYTFRNISLSSNGSIFTPGCEIVYWTFYNCYFYWTTYVFDLADNNYHEMRIIDSHLAAPQEFINPACDDNTRVWFYGTEIDADFTTNRGFGLKIYYSVLDGTITETVSSGGGIEAYYSRFEQALSIKSTSRFWYCKFDAQIVLNKNDTLLWLYNCIIRNYTDPVITGIAGANVYIDNVNFLVKFGITVVTANYEGLIMGNSIDMDLDIRGREMISDGDSGAGIAGTTQVTNVIDEAIGAGVGSIKMKTANAGTSTGWLKVYVNGNVRYIPYFTNISP